MIYTFQKINSFVRVMFYAENKVEAFKELYVRYGKDAENYSLIAYTEYKKFNLTL
jgi:hypothetical protein